MEKLQAALEKARARRQTGGPDAVEARSEQAQKTRGGKKARLWSALPEIGLSREALRHHRVVTQTASETATPFDIMRTKVLLQMQRNGWKRLAITSPMPKSGKTTTACNLALGLGRQSGIRSILFDFDLGDPSVNKFMEFTPKHPVSDVLLGEVDFSEQAVRVGENVAVSASGQIEDDPTRVLLNTNTEETLDSIQTAYAPDIMIFDTPSILVGDNTRAFLKNVDCALIIARANGTRYSHFDACEREVAEYTNVLGVVLNAFRTKDAQSYME